MKFEVNNGIVRGIPLAVLITVLVQVVGAVWWVSAKARDTDYLEQKVLTLETGFSTANETQNKIMERLARIEERTQAQTVLLERIDKQVSAQR